LNEFSIVIRYLALLFISPFVKIASKAMNEFGNPFKPFGFSLYYDFFVLETKISPFHNQVYCPYFLILTFL